MSRVRIESSLKTVLVCVVVFSHLARTTSTRWQEAVSLDIVGDIRNGGKLDKSGFSEDRCCEEAFAKGSSRRAGAEGSKRHPRGVSSGRS